MISTAYAGGSTDVTVYLKAFTASTGEPKTDITDATSGLTLAYVRNRAANTTFAAASQTATGAHTDGGIVHLAGGVYRVDIPDAAVASGADYVTINAYGVTDCVFTSAHLDITGSNPRTADLTATDIANAVVEAEIDALETYNRSSNTSATITGPINGATTLTITTDAAYEPIASIS